jgi:hypothetical protein
MRRLHLLLANLPKTQLAAKTPSRRDFASILDLRVLAIIPQAKHQPSPLTKRSLGLLPVPALQAKLLLGQRCSYPARLAKLGFLVECILAEHLHVGYCCLDAVTTRSRAGIFLNWLLAAAHLISSCLCAISHVTLHILYSLLEVQNLYLLCPQRRDFQRLDHLHKRQ